MDNETIKEAILKLLGGKMKRQIKPYDLVEEVSQQLEMTDKKPIWDSIRQLKLDNFIHDEIYLAIGAPKRGKGFDKDAVEPLKASIMEALTKDDYQSQKGLQTELKAGYETFKAATDALKLEGKIKFAKDPSLGWLLCLAGSRTVTQRPTPQGGKGPSKPVGAAPSSVADPF